MNIFKQIALNFRLIKFKRFIGSVIYTFQRDSLDRQYEKSKRREPVKNPGYLLEAEPTNRGALFRFEAAELTLNFLSPDLVRVDWQPGLLPIPYAIAREDWPEVETQFEKIGDRWMVSSAALKVMVNADGSLEYQDAEGRSLREELPPCRKGEEWEHQAKLRSQEHIYGLGERAAPLNLRAQHGNKGYRMWHYDAGGIYGPGTDPIYLCIPVYVGLHDRGSYLIFYENSFSATFTFSDRAIASFEGGALRYYFTAGEPAKLIEVYTELTGRPPLPPRWAFGYHQSRWGYETEEAVRETAKGFEQHGLLLSAIHLDIDCKDDFRSFTIDPDRFPKIREFNQEMAEKGVRMIAIVNPGVKSDRNSKLYREGLAQEVFCTLPNGKIIIAPVWPGMCAFPDFTNPLARHWWSRQYEYLLDLGIQGFWHDMNDPGVFTQWGDATLPKLTQHHMEGRGGNHVEGHNIYGHLQARAGYEALREHKPDTRPYIVSRSGWAGLQRYAWTWTGDVETSWAGLWQTVPTVLGMGLSGIPYTGPDIGGFKGNPSSELYLRWFQLSTFLPFCRTHSANNVKPRTPWTYGEPTLSIVRELLRLRYKLIPYFYTLAWEANRKGYPPVRPLFWYDWENPKLWSYEDGFFLGDALLIYPVLYEKARSRPAMFPKGKWYNILDDTVIEGSQNVHLDAPLEEIPVFVKAGSILPLEEDGKLMLHLYPPVDGNGTGYLYSDAGDGYGSWRVDTFKIMRTAEGVELTWEEEGAYEFPYHSVELHVHGLDLQQVWVEGTTVEFQEHPPQEEGSPRWHALVARTAWVSCDRFQQVRLNGQFT